MRFVFSHPPMTIYTASFTVDDTNAVDIAPSQGVNANLTIEQLTLVLPETTFVSFLATRTSTPASAATTVYADPLEGQSGGSGLNKPNSAGRRMGFLNGPSAFDWMKRVDTEKLKFRMVFIAWPALVGISMAL